ncbi:MAG: hypothetical protein L3J28_11345 [Candidatus Polarisedimenticolaceae bacterium]|nr:hypothetical protein [Candidatus Polarisedimenticolaceae bacterium]
MTQASHFEQLLTLAGQQSEPQRLLFVFLKAILPTEASAEDKGRFESVQGGQLKPMMCVDKELSELSTFDALVEESKGMGKDWQIVLIATLDGENGVVPTSKVAEEALDTMLKMVQGGGDLSNFMALDRDGDPVHFS